MKSKHVWLRRLPYLLSLALVLLLVLTVYLLKDQFQKPPQTKKVVQQITMIQPPPPPPEQKPPEQEIKKEKIEEPQSEPEPEPEPSPEKADEPPSEALGLDADGTAGSDGFGLAAHKGGRSLLGGGGGNANIWYGGQVSHHVEEGMQRLLTDTPAMDAEYAVTVDVWVSPDGRISRAELASASGKAEVDQALRNALSRLRVSIGKSPPDSMPQPVRIRLSSRT